MGGESTVHTVWLVCVCVIYCTLMSIFSVGIDNCFMKVLQCSQKLDSFHESEHASGCFSRGSGDIRP